MDSTHSPAKHSPQKAYVVAGIFLLILAVCYSFFQVALRSPLVTSWAAQYLSTFLRQPVSLQALELSFGSITVKGLHILNPTGFPARDLAAVDILTVSPAWTEIIGGNSYFRKVAVSGLTVNFVKNPKGEWNYASLVRVLRGRKKDKAVAETIIRELKVERSSLKFNGRGIEDITLDVADLATKGSAVARFDMSATVPGGKLRLSGKGRPGPEPSADVLLEAPSLSLAALPAPHALELAGGTARIVLKTQVSQGVMTGDLTADVAGVKGRVQKHLLPVDGHLSSTFRYLAGTDTFEVPRAILEINRLLVLSGNGRLEQVRRERRFSAELTTEPLSLSAVAAQLPDSFRNKVVPSGRLLPVQLRIAGDGARGVVAAKGAVSLRDGGVAREGKVVVRDLSADVRIEKMVGGWQLHGTLNQGAAGGALPVQNMRASFTGRLNEKLRLDELRSADLAARILGSNATGEATFNRSAVIPVTASLNMPKLSLPGLNRLLGEKVRLSSGELSASADVAGRTAADFKGKIKLEVNNLSGKSGNDDFRIGSADTAATIDGVGGVVTFAGRMGVREGALAGKPVMGSFRYAGSPDSLSLEQGKLHLADLEIIFERIAGAVPRPALTSLGSIPLRLQFHGMACRKGPMELRGMSGMMEALLHRESGRSWLQGGADLTGAGLYYRQEELGGVGARFTLDEKGVEARLAGTLLGGKLSAEARFDPLQRSRNVFSGEIVNLNAGALSKVVHASAALKGAGGTIDASVTGMFKRPDGMAGSVELKGRSLSLVGGGNKTIVTGAGFTVLCDVAGETVTVKKGEAWTGSGATAAFSGEIIKAFSAERHGTVKLKVPTTPVAVFLDSFANLLPRPLQEAAAAGTLSADSILRVKGKEAQLDGDAVIAGVAIDIPAQKISLSGMTGTLPYSVVLPVTQMRAPPQVQHPSRDSYAGYLHFLQDRATQGVPLVIEKLQFGPLELDQTALRLEAADGVIRINSFNSSLAGGILTGRGYLGPGAAGYYGGDLLVNALSLRAFCATIPGIKDYISGKVDGIVSVAGTGKGVGGMSAFIELWARGTKDEKMLVSKEFLQKLAGKNLRGLFFRKDRPYDRGEISGYLDNGYLTFETLDISHTNFFGVKDLSVSVAPVQNKISLDHLINAVKEAAARGKGVKKEAETQPEAEFSWQD